MRWSEPHRLPRQPVRRRGAFLFEAIVALALLAAVATAVASLAGRLAREHQSQTQRLAIRFAAENIVERLRAAAYDELPELADRLRATETARAADRLPATEAFAVEIELQPLSVAGIEGQHVVVTVIGAQQRSGRRMAAVHELWRFGGDSPEDAATEQEESE